MEQGDLVAILTCFGTPLATHLLCDFDFGLNTFKSLMFMVFKLFHFIFFVFLQLFFGLKSKRKIERNVKPSSEHSSCYLEALRPKFFLAYS